MQKYRKGQSTEQEIKEKNEKKDFPIIIKLIANNR